MFKTWLVSAMYSMAKQYFDSDLFERVRVLVKQLLDEDIPGSEKKQIVIDAAQAEFKDMKSIFRTSMMGDIETIIQLVWLKLDGAKQ